MNAGLVQVSRHELVRVLVRRHELEQAPSMPVGFCEWCSEPIRSKRFRATPARFCCARCRWRAVMVADRLAVMDDIGRAAERERVARSEWVRGFPQLPLVLR